MFDIDLLKKQKNEYEKALLGISNVKNELINLYDIANDKNNFNKINEIDNIIEKIEISLDKIVLLKNSLNCAIINLNNKINNEITNSMKEDIEL